MSDTWEHVRAARLPADGLAALAPVRCHPGVSVLAEGESVWVVWPARATVVVECLRPVRGAEFFEDCGGRWHRFGSRLPTDDGPPDRTGKPLDRALVPAPLESVPPAPVGPSARLGIIRGGPARAATALRCRIAGLARWADTATTAEIASIKAARSGGRALLLGDRLPIVPGGERFWGSRVLVPVGYRPEPPLPETVLRSACGVATDELLVLDAAGAEAVPDAAFQPLTRAGVRLALHNNDPAPV